jgi:Zn-dependent protease with chaperone function
MMIQRGGVSFLIGLLWGDITGSAAVIFVTRTMFEVSYSREAEHNADAFAIEAMHALGRSPAPMGELLFRITGAERKPHDRHPGESSFDGGPARADAATRSSCHGTGDSVRR